VAYWTIYGAAGGGHLTWEWQASPPLRSSLHPLLLSAPLWALQRLGLDQAMPALVRTAPKVVHGALAGLTDWGVAALAARWLGPSAAAWTLLAQVAGWFNGYALVRTLAGGLEAALIVAALLAWDEPVRCLLGASAEAAAGASSAFRQSLSAALAALSIVVRPTAVVPWFVLGLAFLLCAGPRRALSIAATAAGPGAGLGFGLAAVADRLFFGRWVPPLAGFVSFNLLTDGASRYGLHHPLWYAVEGQLGVLTSLALPVALALLPLSASVPKDGALRHLGRARRLFALWAASLAALSLVGHKEHRFLLGPLTLLAPVAGLGLARMRGWKGGKAWVAAVLAIQAATLVYLGSAHQAGPDAALQHLAELVQARRVTPQGGAYFLMPCHATSWRASLHGLVPWTVPIGFPDCTPPDARRAALRAAGKPHLATPEPSFSWPPSPRLPIRERAWENCLGIEPGWTEATLAPGVPGPQPSPWSGVEGLLGNEAAQATEEDRILGRPRAFLHCLQSFNALPDVLYVYDDVRITRSLHPASVLASLGADAHVAPSQDQPIVVGLAATTDVTDKNLDRYTECGRFHHSHVDTHHGAVRAIRALCRSSGDDPMNDYETFIGADGSVRVRPKKDLGRPPRPLPRAPDSEAHKQKGKPLPKVGGKRREA